MDVKLFCCLYYCIACRKRFMHRNGEVFLEELQFYFTFFYSKKLQFYFNSWMTRCKLIRKRFWTFSVVYFASWRYKSLQYWPSFLYSWTIYDVQLPIRGWSVIEKFASSTMHYKTSQFYTSFVEGESSTVIFFRGK
jgi:hypothetical protein